MPHSTTKREMHDIERMTRENNDQTLQNGDDEIAGLDIAGLDISGRVCESELGNMLSFWSSVFAQKSIRPAAPTEQRTSETHTWLR